MAGGGVGRTGFGAVGGEASGERDIGVIGAGVPGCVYITSFFMVNVPPSFASRLFTAAGAAAGGVGTATGGVGNTIFGTAGTSGVGSFGGCWTAARGGVCAGSVVVLITGFGTNGGGNGVTGFACGRAEATGTTSGRTCFPASGISIRAGGKLESEATPAAG